MKIFFNRQWKKILGDIKELEDDNKKLKAEKTFLEKQNSVLSDKINELTPRRNEKGQFVSTKEKKEQCESTERLHKKECVRK